jgi:2-iminobutanoate/2-iminopropanoate deaminase
MKIERIGVASPLPNSVRKKPFSDAVLAGDTLYVSGRIGLDPSTGFPPSGVTDEVRFLMDDFVGVLAAAGMSANDLVNVTVFAPDVSHYAAFNEVYLGYFDGALPSRAFVGSGPLLFGARFELTAIAVRS